MVKHLLTRATNRIHALSVIVLMPHSRCNCRCVMCDIWKANTTRREISAEELSKHVGVFRSLGVKEVVLSGGEPLMHSNLWKLCKMLRDSKIKVTLLSTGLLIENNAAEILSLVDQVIISIDGTAVVHNAIRNIPDGFGKIERGIRALKKGLPSYPITGRCVIQRRNYSDFIPLVKSAREIWLDQISFLAADVSTQAFNHEGVLEGERVNDIALNKKQTLEFEQIVKESFSTLRNEYQNRFIAESPTKILRIVQYYKALNREGAFPKMRCNAPWVSAVIESNGDVMPCFFHQPYGNIYEASLMEILNSGKSIDFRRQLNVRENETCKKCVCSINIGPL
jgi:Fe-coproporphyrin III synthase